MEKIFMVIIICFNTICQGISQNTTYPSIEECLAASPAVKEYFMSTLPDSSGQIYCMVKEEFEKWQKQLEENGANILPNIPTT